MRMSKKDTAHYYHKEQSLNWRKLEGDVIIKIEIEQNQLTLLKGGFRVQNCLFHQLCFLGFLLN